MSDERDIHDQLKITDADAEASPADRTEAGANTGSESTREDNVGVLGDVAHPFDQTNGIVDAFDERTDQGAGTVTTPGRAPADGDGTTDAAGAQAGTPGRHAAPAEDDGDAFSGNDSAR